MRQEGILLTGVFPSHPGLFPVACLVRPPVTIRMARRRLSLVSQYKQPNGPMAETQFLPDDAGETKRPDLINVLGILTFINSGIFILVYGIGLLGMVGVSQMPVDEFVTLVMDAAGSYLPDEGKEQFDAIARILHASGTTLMLIYLLRTVARLIGALGIWKGKRSGFFLYAGAQLAGLFLPHLILPWSMLGVFGPLMTVAITALYGTQLKRLS